MTDDELKAKALESYWRSAACGSLSPKRCYILGFIAGTKIVQEENRDLFAISALSALLQRPIECFEDVAKQSYRIADAMIEARRYNNA